ncbi:helix-turn-helix domain-containing protein [Peribacillus faecalis]|uniref:helix-turn-helix domain-containing protein n=1 Tax=Peribacillus faecalis TaxID=2772559 RepID=UPI0022A7AEE8|nr:helix-turn-helix transcriptional regulator [Peribacillus faecalis]
MRRNVHLIQTIGNELRNLRRSNNLQVKDVAKDVGVSSTYISEIERNNKVPSNRLIEKIAQTYNIDEQHLFKGFNIIPDSVIYELTSEHGLYDVLYELSEDESITREEKDKFYQEVKALYMETIKKR